MDAKWVNSKLATVPKLKSALEERGLSTDGKRADLQKLLLDALASSPAPAAAAPPAPAAPAPAVDVPAAGKKRGRSDDADASAGPGAAPAVRLAGKAAAASEEEYRRTSRAKIERAWSVAASGSATIDAARFASTMEKMAWDEVGDSQERYDERIDRCAPAHLQRTCS